MRIIDADKLLKDLKKQDFSCIKQTDIIKCLEDIINKQPEVEKKIFINKVDSFDNRKFL
ncbi:hypothetical protein [Clostridium perfringens]|uniref:Uncharacterized protein n=2 Tax=Clostridium perfringens TaxID=1502 RepID=A0A140GRE6_CLOPF|nr:hypothetical protein [Clostridium perfringens]AMN31105.1 hypothetical protein JFP838_pA0189 [Clostridium perfringens]